MRDAITVFVFGAALGGIGVICTVRVLRRWRDRSLSATFGSLALTLPLTTTGLGTPFLVAAPAVAEPVILLGWLVAATCAAAWAVTHWQDWRAGRRMRRLAADAGRPVRRPPLSGPVLILLYLGTALAWVYAAAGLYSLGFTSLLTEQIRVAGMPPMAWGIAPAILLAMGGWLHLAVRYLFAPLLREFGLLLADLRAAYLSIGHAPHRGEHPPQPAGGGEPGTGGPVTDRDATS